MINLRFLMVYHRHTLLYVTCFLLITNTSVSGEDVSVEQELQNIILGSMRVSVPINSAISVKLGGEDWKSEIISDVGEQLTENPFENYITLELVEDSTNFTDFVFFREVLGANIIQFYRIELDVGVTYEYSILFDWESELDNSTQNSKEVYSDKYITISILSDEKHKKRIPYVAPIVKDAQEVQNLQELDDNTTTRANIETNTNNDSVNDEHFLSSSNVSTIDIGKNNEKIIESAILDELISDDNVAMDNKMKEGENESLTMNKEDSLASKSFVEMNKYISQYWQIYPYEDIINSIDAWISEHPSDQISTSALLWNYGQYLYSDISNSKQIAQIVHINMRIYNEFPLSDYYFDSKNLVEELKKRFRFVIE